MLDKIYSLFLSKNPHKKWFRFLVFFAIVVCLILLYKRFIKPSSLLSEGFSQDSPYVLRYAGDVYDTFYSQIYDVVMEPQNTNDFIFSNAVKSTNPDKTSFFLDAGSGTGYLVNKIKQFGFLSVGIDKSKPMVTYSKKKYPDLQIIQGDLGEPTVFYQNTFSHIISSNLAVYEIEDKPVFFRNCFYWLNRGGFFIIHLVDKPKWKSVENDAKTTYFDNSRIGKDIDFVDFKYRSKYLVKGTGTDVTFSEKFTDASTLNVRENERTLIIDDLDKTVKTIESCGFILFDHVYMKNGGEYIYTFRRPF
jgi:SAM-dependent methyltransferase